MNANKHQNETLLITGASGFVGGHLIRAASAAGWHTAGFFHTSDLPSTSGCTAHHVDITDGNAVASAFDDLQPSVVIHCAAVAGIGICADDKHKATAVNIEGTRNIVESVARTGAYLIYVSTDLVFDGVQGYYRECDPPAPACYYGTTKYAGELITISSGCRYSIARLATVYGHGIGNSVNFLDKLLGQLQRGETSELFDDEYRSFVFIDDVCVKLLKLAADQMSGIFHIAGPERLSAYDFGLKVAKCHGFNKTLLHPISSYKHKRPQDCSLSNEKTIVQLGDFQSVEEVFAIQPEA